MKLREWQEKAFPLWWAKKQGIVKVVTGGGKTFFAIFCLKKYLEKDPTKNISFLLFNKFIFTIDSFNSNLYLPWHEL